MGPPALPSECEQCVAGCYVECPLNTEEQCTDHCIVVPCDNPCLDDCGMCTTLASTQYERGQSQGLDDLFNSCADLSYLGSCCSNLTNQACMSQEYNGAFFPDWSNTSLSKELDALACACSTPHSSDCSSCDPRLLLAERTRHNQSPLLSLRVSASAPISSPSSSASVLFSPKLTPSDSTCSSPDPLSFSHLVTRATTAEVSDHRGPMDQRYLPEPLICLWAACGRPFDTPQDLVTHVNTVHLQLSLSNEGLGSQRIPFPVQPSISNDEGTNLQGLDFLSCLWDNCDRYPTPSQVPGPSIGNVVEAAKGLLASHIQQDHLGIPASHQSARDELGINVLDEKSVDPDVASGESHSVSNIQAHRCGSPPSSSDVGSAQSLAVPSASQYLCKWQPCSLAEVPFSSPAELTSHIAEVHVGVGNSRYHCWWEGCNRNGESGFTSKQKILRHLQSHTGHRPFKCEECNQYFSEAATLQQHKRRHTNEKPYICDFPGCNKAFAITGALTIHRRVHSGSKPFKCPHCTRSFSESSNLSKHVRTHTGDRPYACPYPGCEKRFARPDQVSRHKNVHTKKANTGPTPKHVQESATSTGKDMDMGQ